MNGFNKKSFLAMFFLMSIVAFAQQTKETKLKIYYDACGHCTASANGVKCGRCNSAMYPIINKERKIENIIKKETTYRCVFECSKCDHSISCESNVKFSKTQAKSTPKNSVNCPICKRELEPNDGYLIDLYLWETCHTCKGKGVTIHKIGNVTEKKPCWECKEYTQITGKKGQALYPKAKMWRCPNYIHGNKYFSLDMKELKIRTIKGRECIDDVVKINQ